MRFTRSSGVLLHPSSLPGRFGIGDLGPEARRFVDFLAETGQSWWQVLPLGPVGGMHSPYQSHSSFAGNFLLISPDDMVERGWLEPEDLPKGNVGQPRQVDFRAAARLKAGLLWRAFKKSAGVDLGFQRFLEASTYWLDDYALFEALKQETGGKPWYEWEPALVARKPAALAKARERLAEEIHYHQFVQYVFAIQMQATRDYCLERGIKLIGDVPIFTAHDSADVWSRPDLFHLDSKGRPTVQAGVPPDLFATTGQLWGNPLYRWEAHEKEGFAWWIGRLSALLVWVDVIRIDHFRGFEAYWEVPGKARTAASGRWVKSPGTAFFNALRQRWVELPLIAEDLGVITPEVDALRDQFDLPGMRVLQFGFSTAPSEEKYLPHRFVPHCVAYTGTHDNDTSLGWLTSANTLTTQSRDEVKAERAFALRYAGTDGKEFHWDMIRLALGSVADVAIVPMQDLLGLGSEARMNVPGRAEGNWGWRYDAGQLTLDVVSRLAELTAVFSRWNGPMPARIDPRRLPPRAPARARVRARSPKGVPERVAREKVAKSRRA